jgi:hypothetical protein
MRKNRPFAEGFANGQNRRNAVYRLMEVVDEHVQFAG